MNKVFGKKSTNLKNCFSSFVDEQKKIRILLEQQKR